jgi:hypothetical protein
MGRNLVELRILPPFAIARLGPSSSPMDNYKLVLRDPIGARIIEADDTYVVDPNTGTITLRKPPFPVNFRDEHFNIRPICPFLEVWARFADDPQLVPLTQEILSELGLGPDAVKWSVHVANLKAFRRTDNVNDRIEANAGLFSDHSIHELHGKCNNFIDDKFIKLGSVRYIKPTATFPEIRLRFTPAAGHVYGPPPGGGGHDANIVDEVYDPAKGRWQGYADAVDVKKEMVKVRRTTNPGNIYAGSATGNDDGSQISYGYLDDECDGLVEVELTVGEATLNAFARVAAGPPTFAPDSKPVRTVADELEQAMFGPDVDAPATEKELAELRNDVTDIVRRALETVRLMNTAQMNKASEQRGVGMARMDFLDYTRGLGPIAEPSLADSLAIQARHERVLLALESGSLAWFANVLRDYDKVGDLSDEGRRKMPALMRNADGRHLALTRRQVNKVRAAARYFAGVTKGEKS